MSGRSDLAKGWCPGALRPMPARDGLLVRLRITGGIVPAATAHAIADLAERHGNGRLDLSARANLQLRGVREDALPALWDGLAALDLLDGTAEAEAVRNVLASPLAGLGRPPSPALGRRPDAVGSDEGGLGNATTSDNMPGSPSSDPALRGHLPPRPGEGQTRPGEGAPDIRPLVAALEQALISHPALHALPPKFGLLVDDGGDPSLSGIAADLRFDWVGTAGAFTVGLGGTVGDSLSLGLVAPEDLVATARAIALRLLAVPGTPRRLHRLIRDFGRERVAAWFGAEAPSPAPVSMPPQVVGQRTFRGIPVFGAAALFGHLNAAMLRALARLAESASGEMRLTPWRTILLPQAVPTSAEIAALAAAGFIVEATDPRLRVAACVGRRGCERGTTDAPADAARLAPMAADLPGAGVTMHVSGCAKGCARPEATTVTLVGRDGRYDLVRDGRPGDEATLHDLDLAAIEAELRASSAAKRGRGTMRSMVEGAAASSLCDEKGGSQTTIIDARPPPPPPSAVSLLRFAGEDRPTGRLRIVGLGPGDPSWITPEAAAILAGSSDLVGYAPYLARLAILPHQTVHASDNRVEIERARDALALAAGGRDVAVVSGGDPGGFAMAAAVFEAIEAGEPAWRALDIAVSPGISAMQAAAARLGAPLGHDFCAISLSDNLKPWPLVARRLRAAAAGDFVIALYNPASRARPRQIFEAFALLRGCIAASTPVAFARAVGRPDECLHTTTLGAADPGLADMATLVLIGSSGTRFVAREGAPPWMVTPRGAKILPPGTGEADDAQHRGRSARASLPADV